MSFLNLMSSSKSSAVNSALSVDYTGNYWVINGVTDDLAVDIFGTWQYNPNCIYHNGSTYFTYKEHQNAGRQRPWIAKYNNNVISKHLITEADDTTDYHDHPTISIDSDGYIYVIKEHHLNYPRFFKSNNPSDITSWTEVLSGLPHPSYDYPKAHNFGNIFHLFGRQRSPWGLGSSKSTSGGAWSGVGRVTSAEIDPALPAHTDPRHYPMMPTNWVQDDWIHFIINKRVTFDDDITYPYPYRFVKAWHLKTPNNDTDRGLVWYNQGETSSKVINPFPNSAFTEPELNADYLIWEQTSVFDAAENNGCAILNGVPTTEQYMDGKYYQIVYENGSWIKYESNNNHYVEHAGDNFTLYQKDIVRRSITKMNSNYLPTSEYKNFYVPPDGIYNMRPPVNFDKIPVGQKFAIVAGTLKNGCTHHSTCAERNDVIIWECIKK